MKKLLITGGKGFFCTRLADFMKDRYEILSTDKDDLDIVDEQAVIQAFRNFKPDYVLHAAAIAVTDFCNKHPEIAHDINVKGAVNVAKACNEVKAKLVFLSSEQVFNGNQEGGPYKETDTPVPDTVYGQNKLEAEKLLKDILPELWVLRLTWQFGLPQRGHNMAANIVWDTLQSIIKGEKIKVPVNEFRGMTYVQETIENFEKIFEIPYGIYHVGSVNPLSRYEVVRLIFQEMGIGYRIDDLVIADAEKYRERPRDARLDTSKLAAAGIRFETTEVGIKNCIRDYKLNL